jgi:hypothetical protein
MDIYKCPKSIFENTFGNQKTSFLYILTIFLLKEQRTQIATPLLGTEVATIAPIHTLTRNTRTAIAPHTHVGLG